MSYIEVLKTWFDHEAPILGQLVSIAFQGAGSCLMFYLMADAKYKYVPTMVARFKYLFLKNQSMFLRHYFGLGMVLTIIPSVFNMSLLSLVVGMIVLSSGIFLLLVDVKQHSEEQIAFLNEPYTWHKENPVYSWYALKAWSTLGICFGLCHQLGLGQVYTKPKEFFISSPLSSLSFIFIILHLVSLVNHLKRENMQLKLNNAFWLSGVKSPKNTPGNDDVNPSNVKEEDLPKVVAKI